MTLIFSDYLIKILTTVFLMFFLSTSVMAKESLDFSGKINLSRQQIKESGIEFSSVRSNGSSVGVSGETSLRHGMTGLFKLEYNIKPDKPYDESGGNKTEGDITLSKGFVALAGIAGQLQIGHFSTPLKDSLGGIDKFNNLKGDISRVLSTGEIQISDAIMYSSPAVAGLQLKLSHVSYEDQSLTRNDGISASLTFNHQSTYIAAAYDSGVENQNIELARLVIRQAIGRLTLAGMAEAREAPGVSTTGWMVSGTLNISEFLSVYAQHGQSDNKLSGAVSTSAGASYALAENVELFTFATEHSSDLTLDESEYGLGISYAF
ncbi:MAG: porin [Saccharospirillaceae bacterium]|nr:porin [Saccharospirillaceae bacterium]MCD8530269.1 porin [Saccharospirillaceae bacterium]